MNNNEDLEVLKIVTKDGDCFAVFPNSETGCQLVGDDLAINYFMRKTPFMVREHGYMVDLDFIEVDEFMRYCNRDDLGVTATSDLTEKDEFDLAVYLA